MRALTVRVGVSSDQGGSPGSSRGGQTFRGRCMSSHPVSRRAVLAGIGAGAAGAVLGGVLPGRLSALSGNWTSGYIPDGTAGLSAAFPLSAIRLLDSPMRANRARNTNYLLFVDPDRMLHTFRLNYGLPSWGRPCGGWGGPGFMVPGAPPRPLIF